MATPDKKNISGKRTVVRTVTRRRYKPDPETGLISDLFVSSIDPSVKSEYYFAKKLSIGAKNATREIEVMFQSMEAQDNKELLHLLGKMARS